MPVFKARTAFEFARNMRFFVELGIGLGRDQRGGRFSGSGTDVASPDSNREVLGSRVTGRTGPPSEVPARVREQLATQERAIAELRKQLIAARNGSLAFTIRPENMIWLFGSGRTGSSWLSAMMADMDGYERWNEPYVGVIFGSAYYQIVGDRMRGRRDFIMGDGYRETWLNSIRNFVLEGAEARFPSAGKDAYLVVKEPNGSLGAPLVMEAMPESRMVLLVRDPRDIISSNLAASKKGSWGDMWRAQGNGGASLADTDPDRFVAEQANSFMATFGKAKEAYEAHGGPKVMLRYEDLRYETLSTMRHLYTALGTPVTEEQLRLVVDKHAWENVPEEKKGADKPHRKAKPGGWLEDLTSGQAKKIEQITAPVLEEFYAG